jgi:probable HAF family extracellular repeat protein
VTDLGALSGGTSSSAEGINNSGQVIGASTATGGVHYAFLYSGGAMQNLGSLSLGSSSVASAINNRGQVVGGSTSSDAFLYSGGTLQDLGTFGGPAGWAFGISDSGQVVGWADTRSGHEDAFLYSGGTIQDIGTLLSNTFNNGVDDNSSARSINDSGQVVGLVNTRVGGQAFLYSGGTAQLLGEQYLGSALHINNNGQIVGFATFVSNNESDIQAFLYSNGTMCDLGTLPGCLNSEAISINDSGQAVGWAFNRIGTPDSPSGVQLTDQHALLFSGGSLQDLNNLIPSNSGWTLQQATGINDNGQIVGRGINPGGQVDAFLLTPTPEPSTLALLSAGAIGLLGFAWRRRKTA